MLTKRIFPSESRKLGALDYSLSVLIFILLASIFYILFSSLLGIALFKLPSPLKMIDIASIIALYFSAFASSFIISKKNGQKYFLCALFSSLILCAFFIVSYLLGKKKVLSYDFLLRQGSVLFCFFGAFLGRKREKNKKRKHRR